MIFSIFSFLIERIFITLLLNKFLNNKSGVYSQDLGSHRLVLSVIVEVLGVWNGCHFMLCSREAKMIIIDGFFSYCTITKFYVGLETIMYYQILVTMFILSSWLEFLDLVVCLHTGSPCIKIVTTKRVDDNDIVGISLKVELVKYRKTVKGGDVWSVFSRMNLLVIYDFSVLIINLRRQLIS